MRLRNLLHTSALRCPEADLSHVDGRTDRNDEANNRFSWVDNIRMDLQEVGCGYVDWIGLAQDRDRWRTFVSNG